MALPVAEAQYNPAHQAPASGSTIAPSANTHGYPDDHSDSTDATSYPQQDTYSSTLSVYSVDSGVRELGVVLVSDAEVVTRHFH